jgi:branched-chain amino acid transport system substrate-binding protein
MKSVRNLVVLSAVLASSSAFAQYTDGVIKIGVMNDMSGTYSDLSGQGSVIAARMAVEDFGAAAKGMKVEIVGADHQNKPDVGSNVVRSWIDRDKVDVIVDVPTSSVALAVNEIVRDKNKVFLVSGAGASDLTGAKCSPNTIHWTYDTWALGNGTGTALVKSGANTWFFLTADYAFGHALERDTAAVVEKNGGKVLGKVRHPFPGTDFSSFLLQAQASKAKIIGLANAGADTINSIKQAAEFGITRRGTKLAALLMFLPDVHALGLQTAQGLVLTESFYWDLNDRTRAVTARLQPRLKDVKPNMASIANYSAALHYLKAVADMGVAASKASGVDVVNRMKAMPCDDDAFGPGRIREDGRKLCPSYLFEVKTPAESKAPWDYYKLVQTTPAEEAFRPLNEGGCPLVRS